MAAILVEEADLKRLFRSLEKIDEIYKEALTGEENYERNFYRYFKLKYNDLADTKKNCRLWYQAYKRMTDQAEKDSCYKQYYYYKEQCSILTEQIEDIKNKYYLY